MDLAKLIERAKGICLSPKAEWEKIAAETTDVKSIYTNYAMILALIPAVCGFLGMSLIGISMPMIGTIRTPIGAGIAQLVIGYVLGLGVLYVVSLIVNALAPTFDGQKDAVQALKLVVYSSTPVWIAGVLSLVPMLGMLTIIDPPPCVLRCGRHRRPPRGPVRRARAASPPRARCSKA